MLVCAYKRRFKEITLDVLLLFIFQEQLEITLGKDVVGDVVEEREVGQLLLHHLLRLHLHHLSESFKLSL